MLQKGFLESREKEENTRTLKNSRMFLLVGVLTVLAAFVYMTSVQQQGDSSSIKIAGIMMIVGMALVVISLWMNFFQNKKRHK